MSTERTSQHPVDAPRTSSPRRGLNGVILKAYRAQDLRLRVLSREQRSERLLRLTVDVGDLLERDDVYPTYWLRLWFTTPAGRGHQRAYTLVDPDPATGTAAIEFYLHPGVASDWARGARTGDEIDATVLNGRNPVADSPTSMVLIGDGASLPAIRDLLRREPGITATVLLERGYANDPEELDSPAREGVEVAWFDRDGSIETAAWTAGVEAPAGTTFFVSLESAATRRIGAMLRKQLEVPKERIHALAYWKRG
ncbi:siderophore-interacting protein [Brachybacterium sp. DNPG3]